MYRPITIAIVRRIGIAAVPLLLSMASLSDDLTGSDALVCYGWSAARCDIEGTCEVTEPWQLNLPDFLRIDLEAKLAVTTEPAPQPRETEIHTVVRENNTIILQGFQDGRAFSWLIQESSGEGTLTVSTPGEGLTVFTNCTPIEKL